MWVQLETYYLNGMVDVLVDMAPTTFVVGWYDFFLEEIWKPILTTAVSWFHRNLFNLSLSFQNH